MALTKTDLQAIQGLLKENNAHIGDAMERGFNRVDERIDGLEDTMERRFDKLDDRLDRYGKTDEDQEKRIKKLEKVYSSA